MEQAQAALAAIHARSVLLATLKAEAETSIEKSKTGKKGRKTKEVAASLKKANDTLTAVKEGLTPDEWYAQKVRQTIARTTDMRQPVNNESPTFLCVL